MTEIYVIRHVQAEGNLYRHMQGHWDGDVTPVGQQQRDALSLRFRDIPVDAVYSSDLYRARFTASAITRYHDLPVQCDRRLREINIGPWETEPFANVIWAQPELFDAFLHDPEHFFLPGAETFMEVQERAAEAVYEIAEQNPDRTVVITTHGITIRCLLTKLLGIPLGDTGTVPIFHNTGVAHLLYENGGFTVDSINDASHLPPELLRRVSDIPALRHVCISPAQYRDTYESCYADAWRAAHGNLRGFEADTYYESACEHYRRDRESVMLLYEGDSLAGLLDLDTARGAHADYGWISLLYLRPEYRGRGLGVQLLGRAVAKYRKMGRRSIRLHVAQDNRPALAFYLANGFVELSHVPGAQAELLLMEKPLRNLDHDGI
jgi:Fructose-2,6-bisphosphatase